MGATIIGGVGGIGLGLRDHLEVTGGIIMLGSMSESEINALLDAHDALVKAYVDSSLTFSEFVSAYGDFPRNYAFGDSGAVLKMFRKRVAFHALVAGVLSGLRSADDAVDIQYIDAGRFLPDVGLMRLRELVARYPEFRAEPDI